jgi:polysaccharide transporter, PST family
MEPSLTQSPSRMLSRRNLFSSTVLVSETAVRLGMVALVSFWIARAFGPEQFGLLNYASALVMVFWSAALLGIETPLVARLAREKLAGKVLGSALVLRIVAGFIAFGASVAAVTVMRSGEEMPLLLTMIVAVSIPLSAPYVIDCWFKVRNEPGWPAAARLFGTLASLAAKVAVLLLDLSVVALAWTIAVEAALTSAALLYAHRRVRDSSEEERLRSSRQEMLSLSRACWPYLVSTTVMAIYMKIDVVMLGALSGDHQTGIFSLSQKITEVTFLIPVVVVDVLFPQLVRHQSGTPDSAQAASQVFFDLTAAVALTSVFVSALLVWLFLPQLFGEAYRSTSTVFLVHVWGALGMALAHARFKWMAVAGHERLAPVVTACGLAMAVCLHLVLIPTYGAIGAAVGTSIAYLSSGVLASFVFRPLRPAGMMQLRSLFPWVRLWRELRRT